MRKQNITISHKLFAVTRLLEKASNLLFAEFGVTLRVYEILQYIEQGHSTTVELAGLFQSSLPNITHKTKLLEKEGYIKRMAGGNDRRIWNFELTVKGVRILKRMNDLYQEAMDRLYAQLGNGQEEHVLQFLVATEKHLRMILADERHLKAFATTFKKKSSNL